MRMLFSGKILSHCSLFAARNISYLAASQDAYAVAMVQCHGGRESLS